MWNFYLDCLQQPLIIFGLTLIASSFWFPLEISVVIALISALLIKVIFEILLVTNEKFCSLHNDRWCPEKDVCFAQTDKENATLTFLNDNDAFIKELYDFTQPDDPAYVQP